MSETATSFTGKVIGFIGAGQMASAMAAAFVKSQLCKPDQLLFHDHSDLQLQVCKSKGYCVAKSNKEVMRKSDVIFLAVKPQSVSEALIGFEDCDQWTELAPKLFISICAGVTHKTLRKYLPQRPFRVVRVMPNTPCLLGKGASAFCLEPGASREDAQIVETLMGALGVVHKVSESQMDAVTGLSGSGPAYIYTVVEALSDAGVLNGIPRNVSDSLAIHTVLGSAAMLAETGTHPAVLKGQVTSPGGTTIEGVAALERHGLRNAVISAVTAATRRATELGIDSSEE